MKPVPVRHSEPNWSRWTRPQKNGSSVDAQVARIVSWPIGWIGAVDLDVEPVDGDREAREEARLEHHADRPGVGDFRLEIRVAADQAVILAGRVGR